MNFVIWNKPEWFYKMKYLFQLFVNNKYFESFITICIVFNTIALALNYHGMSDEQKGIMEEINIGFTVIFGIEMIAKLLAYGFVSYFKDLINYLDTFIVVYGIIEIFIFSNNTALSAFRTIRVLRALRALRIAKIFRYLRSMNLLISVIGRSF